MRRQTCKGNSMIENDVIMTTKYGRQPSFVVCPDELGQFPAIILYMDAPGIREELRDQARRIAKHGYVCLLPDLYYRLGMLRFDIPRRDEAMSVVIRGAMKSLNNVAVTDDTAGMLAVSSVTATLLRLFIAPRMTTDMASSRRGMSKRSIPSR